MNIIYIGDIVGRPGREITKAFLERDLEKYDADLVLANGENAAGGNGLTKRVAEELFSYGVDGLSMGNHVWDKRDILDILDNDIRVVRPANFPPGTPGKDYTILRTKNNEKVALINLLGRIYLGNYDCPFQKIESLLPEINKITPNILVDFHAEATSEKMAMGWFLDGKVSAVFGTHTHVQTNDEKILPQGTAYITDLGMTGPVNSILGVKSDLVIKKLTSHMPVKFELATGKTMIAGVIVKLSKGKAINIEKFSINSEDFI